MLSDSFAFGEMNNCQYETLRELKRWSFMQNINANLGASTTGGWLIAVPIDLDDQNTNKSVYNFRIGTESNMTWVDHEKWDELLESIAYTTLAAPILIGATTITLTNSADFLSPSGSIIVGANTYSYTANNTTTGVLTVAATTTQNSNGSAVFQGSALGEPEYWTTYGGNVYHYPAVDSTLGGKNYYMDYYKSLTQIVNDTDVIVIPDPVLVQYYLEWKFLKKLNNGEDTQASTAAQQNYLNRQTKLKTKEVLGTSYVLKSRFNDWSRQMSGLQSDDRSFRDNNFKNLG